MPISNYNRFPQGINVAGMNVLNTYAGNVYWVDSGTGSDGNKGTYRNPLATVDNAIGKCTANNGDIIIMFPGHSETVTTSIAADVAGITICGLGHGTDKASLMGPAADACIDVSAANIAIKNVRFLAQTGTTQAATQQINIAAAHCHLDGCMFLNGLYDDASVYITTAGDWATITNCSWHCTANGPDIAIQLEGNGVLTNVTVQNCWFDGGSTTNAWDEGAIYSSGVHTSCLIDNNKFMYSALCVEFVAAATGMICNNFFGDGTIDQMIDPGSCMCFENYQSTTADKSGEIWPSDIDGG